MNKFIKKSVGIYFSRHKWMKKAIAAISVDTIFQQKP